MLNMVEAPPSPPSPRRIATVARGRDVPPFAAMVPPGGITTTMSVAAATATVRDHLSSAGALHTSAALSCDDLEQLEEGGGDSETAASAPVNGHHDSNGGGAGGGGGFGVARKCRRFSIGASGEYCGASGSVSHRRHPRPRDHPGGPPPRTFTSPIRAPLIFDSARERAYTCPHRPQRWSAASEDAAAAAASLPLFSIPLEDENQGWGVPDLRPRSLFSARREPSPPPPARTRARSYEPSSHEVGENAAAVPMMSAPEISADGGVAGGCLLGALELRGSTHSPTRRISPPTSPPVRPPPHQSNISPEHPSVHSPHPLRNPRGRSAPIAHASPPTPPSGRPTGHPGRLTAVLGDRGRRAKALTVASLYMLLAFTWNTDFRFRYKRMEVRGVVSPPLSTPGLGHSREIPFDPRADARGLSGDGTEIIRIVNGGREASRSLGATEPLSSLSSSGVTARNVGAPEASEDSDAVADASVGSSPEDGGDGSIPPAILAGGKKRRRPGMAHASSSTGGGGISFKLTGPPRLPQHHPDPPRASSLSSATQQRRVERFFLPEDTAAPDEKSAGRSSESNGSRWTFATITWILVWIGFMLPVLEAGLREVRRQFRFVDQRRRRAMSNDAHYQ